MIYAYPITAGVLCALVLALYFAGPWLTRRSKQMRHELDEIRKAHRKVGTTSNRG